MTSTFANVLVTLTIFACIITISLNVVWIVKLLYKLYKSLKLYRGSKYRTGTYRPIYGDAESLSKSVDLYNHKTDIVKFLVLIAICALEIWQILYSYFYRFIFLISPKLNHTHTHQGGDNILLCNFDLVKNFEHTYLILLINVDVYGYLLLIVLLTVLTRFLSARNLLHPVKTSLKKYLVWFLIQSFIITLSSTTYTYPLFFFLTPSFVLINILLLVRESIVLRNVLKMNANSANIKQTYSSSSDQLIIYKHYKLFRILLLLSLFVSLILIILVLSSTAFKLLLCQTNGTTHLSADSELIMRIFFNLDPLFTLLFLLSYGGPLWIYSVANIIVILMRSYSARNKQSRFNYSNTNVPLFRPLI